MVLIRHGQTTTVERRWTARWVERMGEGLQPDYKLVVHGDVGTRTDGRAKLNALMKRTALWQIRGMLCDETED